MGALAVPVNQMVTRGTKLSLFCYEFGDGVTTIRLHFDIKQMLTIDEVTDYYYVPPYSSLIAAYEALLQRHSVNPTVWSVRLDHVRSCVHCGNRGISPRVTSGR